MAHEGCGTVLRDTEAETCLYLMGNRQYNAESPRQKESVNKKRWRALELGRKQLAVARGEAIGGTSPISTPLEVRWRAEGRAHSQIDESIDAY